MIREQEFKVNEFLTVRLEEPFDPRATRYETVIYVGGRYFRQCKFLLLDIPIDNVSSLDEIDSIDEAAEKLDKSQEPVEGYEPVIPPEVEFWGHCSNLQVWYESNYDTRLLHSNLAFPLLKRLTDAGDPLAKRVFKEEIAMRLARGYMPVIEYLRQEGFINYLTHAELITALLRSEEANAILELESIMNKKFEIEFDDPYQMVEIYDPNIIIKNKRIIALKLYECKVIEVENLVQKFKNLICLQIFFNNLKLFPKFIFTFKELELLSIDGLEIDSLPKEVCTLKKIRRLYFYECIIKNLPDCIKKLEKLETVVLYDNFLDTDSKLILEEIKSEKRIELIEGKRIKNL